MNNQEKIAALKETLDNFAKICYIMGKKEGLEGILEESPSEMRQIPLELLEEIISEIKEEPKAEIGSGGIQYRKLSRLNSCS